VRDRGINNRESVLAPGTKANIVTSLFTVLSVLAAVFIRISCHYFGIYQGMGF